MIGPRPAVAAVVVNFERPGLTARCLESLLRQDYDRLSAIVVDNGSTDDSARVLQRDFPGVRLLTSPRNLGFAAGCNLALRRCRAEETPLVWLLNNDTEPRPDALTELVATISSDPTLGGVASVLLRATDLQVQAWGGGTVSLRTGFSREVVSPDEVPSYLTGASLLLRFEALAEVGLLDESFFLYWEDADLSFRLRAAGWRLGVAERSSVVHEVSASAGFLEPWWDEQFLRSAWTFFCRHAPAPLVPFVSCALLRAGARARRGQWRNVAAIARGVTHALARRSEGQRPT